MKYYSEEVVKKIITDAMRYGMEISQTVPMSADSYPGICLPDKYGRLIDGDKFAVAVAKAQDSMLHKEYDPFMLLGDVLRWIALADTVLEAST